jgi:hypothetical protein
MRKVPPSVMVREQINQALFSEGLDSADEEQTNLLSTLAQLGLSYLVQQALEQEKRTSSAVATTSVVGVKSKLGAGTATVTKRMLWLPPRGRLR